MDKPQEKHTISIPRPVLMSEATQEQQTLLAELNAWRWLACSHKKEQLAPSFRLFLERLERGQGDANDIARWNTVLTYQQHLREQHPDRELSGASIGRMAQNHVDALTGTLLDQGINLIENFAYFDSSHNSYRFPEDVVIPNLDSRP